MKKFSVILAIIAMVLAISLPACADIPVIDWDPKYANPNSLTETYTSSRHDASGPKITSNSHSPDFPGMYFRWIDNIKGVLLVYPDVFGLYEDEKFTVTIKVGGDYLAFDITKDPDFIKDGDELYAFGFPNKVNYNGVEVELKDIEMIFVDGIKKEGIIPGDEKFLELVKTVDGAFLGDWLLDIGDVDVIHMIAESMIFEIYKVESEGADLPDEVFLGGDVDENGYILLEKKAAEPGWYAIVETLKDKSKEVFDNENGIVGPYYIYFDGETKTKFEFDNKEFFATASFNKRKVGGIIDNAAGEREFCFDLYKYVDGAEDKWIGDYYTNGAGTVFADKLKVGRYYFVERNYDDWTIDQQYNNGVFFTIEAGNHSAVWDTAGNDELKVINKTVLGQSYSSVTATNLNSRDAIIAGLNEKNGNPRFDSKFPDDSQKSTPRVVPNSNHFVFAKLTKAELQAGVVLDMMVGNKFEVVGKAFVKLDVDDKNIVITINGEGTFGAIAFNQLPVTNNGNIHSQKEKDLVDKFGATTGFSHDNKTKIPLPKLCNGEDTIYLYIHCDPIQFYKGILMW
jgi:hypothetical protein